MITGGIIIYFQIITFAKYFFLHSKGMATNFIIQRSIEHGGVFPKEEVATFCHLAGWSEVSGAWTLYVKTSLSATLIQVALS